MAIRAVVGSESASPQTKTGTLIHVPAFYRNRGTSPKVPVLDENEPTLHAKLGKNSKKEFLFRIWNKTGMAGKWRQSPEFQSVRSRKLIRFLEFAVSAEPTSAKCGRCGARRDKENLIAVPLGMMGESDTSAVEGGESCGACMQA